MPDTAQLSPVAQDTAPFLEPHVHAAAPDRHVFVVCSGESCRHAGSNRLLGLLRRRCTHAGDNLDIRISSSKCIGRCGTAPAMLENGQVVGWMSMRRLKSELLRLGLIPTAS